MHQEGKWLLTPTFNPSLGSMMRGILAVICELYLQSSHCRTFGNTRCSATAKHLAIPEPRVPLIIIDHFVLLPDIAALDLLLRYLLSVFSETKSALTHHDTRCFPNQAGVIRNSTTTALFTERGSLKVEEWKARSRAISRLKIELIHSRLRSLIAEVHERPFKVLIFAETPSMQCC